MTNKERLQANNDSLREAISRAETLPDAGGVDVSGVTATPGTVMEGETFVDKNGVLREGTMPLVSGEDLILDVENNYRVLDGAYYEDYHVQIILEEKSVTPTREEQEVVATEGKVLSKVTMAPIPNEYVIPEGAVEITANGEHPVAGKATVIANVPIPEGYIKPSGSVEITDNGEYDVTEKEKVVVNVAQSGGGDVETTNSEWFANYIMDISPIEIYNDKARGTLGAYAFYENSAVTKIELPNIEYLKERCFNGCENLKTLLLPSLVGYTYQYMASGCTSLVNVDVHDASYISSYSFQSCTSLKKLDLHRVGTIGTNAFVGATKFETLIIRTDTVPTLGGTNAFTNTKIKSGGTGYIYVPASLVDSYKAATNWSSFQFRAIEDYPDITGG